MAKRLKKPAPEKSRVIAFDVLAEVTLEGAYSNLLLSKTLAESGLEPRDRALVTELVYGTIRMQGKHDWRISQCIDRSLSEVDPKTLICLRMGAHQIFEMRIPAHAAVSATVELARHVVGESKGTFVNAVLRSLTRLTENTLTDSEERNVFLSHEYSHPQWIISAYHDLLRDDSEVEALLAANNVPAVPVLVAWPARSTQQELIDAGAVAIVESDFAAEFAGDPGGISAIRQRRAGVQDFGSQLVAEIFYHTRGDQIERMRWLDLCAGPGGKAALISSLISANAVSADDDFLANEISEPRAELVRGVISTGKVLSFDGRELPASVGTFDRIIIDAPCTGLGALRRRPEVRWRRNITDLKNLVSLQRELLTSAASVLNEGGVLAYVTCSPHLAETRIQVADFLKRSPEFTQEKVSLPSAMRKVDSRFKNALLDDGAMQLWTHRHGTDSMYMALLRKRKN